MSFTFTPPPQQSSDAGVTEDEQPIMGRGYRTPSPADEMQLMSVENTPRVPNRVSEVHYSDRQDVSSGELAPSTTILRCPETPPSRGIDTSRHGLPTPQTPAKISDIPTPPYAGKPRSEQSDCSKNLDDPFKTAGCVQRNEFSTSPVTSRSASFPAFGDATALLETQQFAPSQPAVERDAELAMQISETSCVRRSARFQNKTKIDYSLHSHQTTKVIRGRKAPIRASSPIPQCPTTPLGALSPVPQNRTPHHPTTPELTQAKPTSSPFEVGLSSNFELPIHNSTEWQLRYPAGGSTHPAYPWPAADPRLTFQSHYVPLNCELPDVSFAPTLVLPAGWRQACWSGLYPVVFDAYQQAFKLTPVGPLPLTCEEVHQGGLQEYVPGGSRHPEFGLLPVLSKFSDGSDYEVFNFEGVDWTLPWAHIEGGFEIEHPTAPVASSMSLHSSLEPAPIKPLYYIEPRDCPDDVIDVEDAWRWLQEWDTTSTAPFQATPGKSWRGSGISITARTVKQPIASLMVFAMANTEPVVDQYLLKQSKREFCPLKSVATPPHVDITLLQDVEFTIVELLSYFPFHYQWRGAADRLVRSGMNSSDIANFINMVRRLPAGSLSNSSTVYKYLCYDRDDGGNRIRVETESDLATCYTAEHWTNKVGEKTDYPLLGLAIGLKTLPSGADAGPLTSIIKWCREQKRCQAMLSDVPSLLKEACIDTLIDPGEGTSPDQDAIDCHSEAMKQDRQRVLKEMKAVKEKNDANVSRESRAKRMRSE